MKARDVPWQPTRFERWEDCDSESSTGVARILTDAGTAYLKALGNAEGPHALVREWVGTSVARWFGLTTFDFAQISLESGFEIPLGREKWAEPGPAFVTRGEAGFSWNGQKSELNRLVNPEAVTGLLIVDTWLLNIDRFPPENIERHPNYDNVYFSIEGLSGKKRRLVAMDFSDCMKPSVSLTQRIADIGNTKDERLFGLFPAFRKFLTWQVLAAWLERLRLATESEMRPIVEALPSAWDVSPELRAALISFLVQRAAFLVEHLPMRLRPLMGDQQMSMDENAP